MFEDFTHEALLEHSIFKADEITEIDTSEGSFLFTALSLQAYELTMLYKFMDNIYMRTFADTCPRAELIRRAKERGLSPKLATKSIVKGEFNVPVQIGARFSLYDLTYKVIEQIDELSYKMECETSGVVGNRYTGLITPLEFTEGLTSSKLTEILILGTDEEETEVFRARYFSSFTSQSYGGNRSDYKEKVKSIQGVGDLKVNRRKQGDIAIPIYVIDSAFNVPSDELIQLIQTTIDPVVNQGEGYGVAPIGHIVNVYKVDGVQVDIETQLTLDTGYDIVELKSSLENAISEYLLGLRKEWAESENLAVRIAQIEARLLGVSGVVDITGTKINGLDQNLILAENQVPTMGVVNAT